MEKVIKQNTEGLRRTLAFNLGVSPQGFASKLNSNPIEFLERLTDNLNKISASKALNIYAELRARLEAKLFPTKKKFALVEVVGIWQLIFVGEIQFPDGNRLNLLQKWRELVVLANLRISELAEILEGRKGFGYA